jgi:hypothetical protein
MHLARKESPCPMGPTKHSIYGAATGGYRASDGRVRLKPNSAYRLLKWLHSPYRPALPEENRGKAIVRRSAAGLIGASPSGKAVDFDSTIRRFESSRPSQPVTQLQIVGW